MHLHGGGTDSPVAVAGGVGEGHGQQPPHPLCTHGQNHPYVHTFTDTFSHTKKVSNSKRGEESRGKETKREMHASTHQFSMAYARSENTGAC
eukprot:COSAG05_NODE_4604_length_1442_cov_1.236039_2_plen_92_part_00